MVQTVILSSLLPRKFFHHLCHEFRGGKLCGAPHAEFVVDLFFGDVTTFFIERVELARLRQVNRLRLGSGELNFFRSGEFGADQLGTHMPNKNFCAH